MVTLGSGDLASSREVPFDARSTGGIVRTFFGRIVAIAIVYVVVGLHCRDLYDFFRQTLPSSRGHVGQDSFLGSTVRKTNQVCPICELCRCRAIHSSAKYGVFGQISVQERHLAKTIRA